MCVAVEKKFLQIKINLSPVARDLKIIIIKDKLIVSVRLIEHPSLKTHPL